MKVDVHEELLDLTLQYRLEMCLFEAANFGIVTCDDDGGVDSILAAIDRILEGTPAEDLDIIADMSQAAAFTLNRLRDLVSEASKVHMISCEKKKFFAGLPWFKKCLEEHNLPFDWVRDWAEPNTAMMELLSYNRIDKDRYSDLIQEIESEIIKVKMEEEEEMKGVTGEHRYNGWDQLDYMKWLFTHHVVECDGKVYEPHCFMFNA